MKFKSKLIKGTFIKRYKRFFSDIRLETGEIVVAHCPNTGAMLGLLDEGNTAYISPSDNPQRKLAYTLEMIEEKGHCVGMNTQHPNTLIKEVLEQKLIEELSEYEKILAEVKINKETRLDFALESPTLPPCYIEVKNAHYKVGNTALFPDAVTLRGQKHLKELMNLVDQGYKACMIYVIQRSDIDSFSFAKNIDPAYASFAKEAFDKGVHFMALSFDVNDQGISFLKKVPVILNKYESTDF